MLYGILPIKILVDYKLSPSEKILYSIILGIMKKEKRVCRKDIELADLMNGSVRSIQRWLNSLRKYGYVKTKMIASGTREIFITDKGLF